MAFNLDNFFGLHAQSLQLRGQRHELLASNIANADTPGYRARDLDFSAALQQAQGQGGSTLARTHSRHMSVNGQGADANVVYRTAVQPSQDGNTVDVQMEQAAFAENALRYQASLEFLNGRIRSLMTAIKGSSQS